MHVLIKKLGISDTVAAIIMVVFGALIVWKPELLAYLVAAYLIIVGLLKLLSTKTF